MRLTAHFCWLPCIRTQAALLESLAEVMRHGGKGGQTLGLPWLQLVLDPPQVSRQCRQHGGWEATRMHGAQPSRVARKRGSSAQGHTALPRLTHIVSPLSRHAAPLHRNHLRWCCQITAHCE
jgi:hypothetical protein